MKHDRLTGNAVGIFRIRCLMAALAGLLIAAGSAAAQTGLWIANENSPTLAEFQGTLKSGSKSPNGLINDTNDLDGSSTIAFDQNENLWVTNFNVNTITEFTKSVWQADARKKHSHPAAAVTISQDAGGHLDGPEGIIFDSSENMWVGAEDGQVILMYTPAQYAASGNPTPDVILNADSFSFSSPSHLAFDAAGNLWVVDENRVNGKSIRLSKSPGRNTFLWSPVTKSSTATRRSLPSRWVIVQTPSSATASEIIGPAGNDMQIFPPTVAVCQILNDERNERQH